jgi:hypothetical protein
MPNQTPFSNISRRSLSVINEELLSAAGELGRELGLSLSFMSADRRRVVYACHEGMVVANYLMGEDHITFNNIDVAKISGSEYVDGCVASMVEAIERDDDGAARAAFNEALGFIKMRTESEEARAAAISALTESNVAAATLPKIDRATQYLDSRNYDGFENLVAAWSSMLVIAERSTEEGVDIVEATRWTSKGGKRPRRVKISRKKKRLAKRVARRNRAQLLKNLKKARKRLRKLSSRASFRRKVSKVRKLNDAKSVDDLSFALFELAQQDQALAYATHAEVEAIIAESLSREGISDTSQATMAEMASSIVTLARANSPESMSHIVEAATAYFSEDYDVPSDNIDEVVEIVNAKLWEAVASEQETVSRTASSVRDMISGVVESIESDLKDEPEDSEDPEIVEIRSVLSTLRGYLADLDKVVEDQDEDSSAKVLSIVNAVMEMFSYEAEDDDPDDESGNDEPDDDNESDRDDESDDDETDDVVAEHGPYSIHLVEGVPVVSAAIDGVNYASPMDRVVESGQLAHQDGGDPHVIGDDGLAWVESVRIDEATSGARKSSKTPYDKLALSFGLIADAVATATNGDGIIAAADKTTLDKVKAIRKKLTPGDVDEFRAFADDKARSAYTANLKWFTRLADDESNDGRDRSYVIVAKWLVAWFEDRERRKKNAGTGTLDLKDVRAGDAVYIKTPQGSTLRGRAVMRSAHGGWVLNMGGRHGTPGLVDEENFVRAVAAKDRKEDTPVQEIIRSFTDSVEASALAESGFLFDEASGWAALVREDDDATYNLYHVGPGFDASGARSFIENNLDVFRGGDLAGPLDVFEATEFLSGSEVLAEGDVYSKKISETGADVRKVLKEKFPKTKFGVRSKTYTGGGSVTIEWTDGPSTKSVDEAVSHLNGRHFDGMDDSTSYTRTKETQSDGSTREVQHYAYIFTERNYSKEFMTDVVAKLVEKTGEEAPEVKFDGKGAYVPYNHKIDALKNRLGRYLHDTSEEDFRKDPDKASLYEGRAATDVVVEGDQVYVPDGAKKNVKDWAKRRGVVVNFKSGADGSTEEVDMEPKAKQAFIRDFTPPSA